MACVILFLLVTHLSHRFINLYLLTYLLIYLHTYLLTYLPIYLFTFLGPRNKISTVCRQSGETVLHKAARLGYPDVAEEKIKEGADIHVRDNAGWCALHEACSYNQYEVAKVLLKYGADPNSVSDSGIR